MYGRKEAAPGIGISDRQLRLLLGRGKIKGKKLGHDWVVLSLDYTRKRNPKVKKGESNGKSQAKKKSNT
jgi:hypothetical protein